MHTIQIRQQKGTTAVSVKNSLILALSAVLFAALWLSAQGFAAAPLLTEKVLQVGESEIIECKDVTRTAVGDPVVADVAALSSREILVNAKSPGKTVLFIWDDTGRRIYKVRVEPAILNMGKLCDDIKQQLDDPRISVRAVGNTVLLEGTVQRESEASRAEAIARAVVEMVVYQGSIVGSRSTEVKSTARPAGESFVIERVAEEKDASVSAEMGLRCPKVVNLIQIEKPMDEVSVRTIETASALRQALNNPAITTRALPGSVVLVEGKVGTDAELARIDQVIKGWAKEGKDDKGMSPTGGTTETVTMVNLVQVDTSVARQIMVRAQVVDINKGALKDFGVDWGRVTTDTSGNVTVGDQPWLIGQVPPGPFEIFGGSRILRFDPIGARIRALQQQNKARILSEPNLLVLDGREANILVGGEIPVPVVQSAGVGSAASVTVEYKEFGVRLRILPTLTGDDRLQLKVMPEVSTLDFANAVEFSGFRIPALRTRRAETIVNVRDGQSLIIGGLIQNETSKLVKQIPVLGDLPIIGELFKSRSFVNNETELVIIITPQIVKAGVEAANAGQTSQPETK